MTRYLAAVLLLTGGCASLQSFQPATDAVAIERGAYVSEATRKIEIGDLYSPSKGFVEGNALDDLKTLCGSELELPAESESFHREMNRSAANMLASHYRIDAGAHAQSVARATVDISSGVRRALDVKSLRECLAKQPQSTREVFRGKASGDTEIVSGLISGSYTVRFDLSKSADAGADVFSASRTVQSDWSQNGVGTIVFQTESPAYLSRALLLNPGEVRFSENEVVKHVSVREGNGDAAEWRLLEADSASGFICFPHRGALDGRRIGKIYVVRLPSVARPDYRFVSLAGTGGGAAFNLSVDTPTIGVESYLGVSSALDGENDPPELAQLLAALHAYYTGDFREAHGLFARLKSSDMDFAREPIYMDLSARAEDILRHSTEKVDAVKAVYKYVSAGFGSGPYGVAPYGGYPLPAGEIRTIRTDPVLLMKVVNDAPIRAAISSDDKLRSAFGL